VKKKMAVSREALWKGNSCPQLVSWLNVTFDGARTVGLPGARGDAARWGGKIKASADGCKRNILKTGSAFSGNRLPRWGGGDVTHGLQGNEAEYLAKGHPMWRFCKGSKGFGWGEGGGI